MTIDIVIAATAQEILDPPARQTPLEGPDRSVMGRLRHACSVGAPGIAGTLAQHIPHAAMVLAPTLLPGAAYYYSHDLTVMSAIGAVTALPASAYWYFKEGKYRSARRVAAMLAVNLGIALAVPIYNASVDNHNEDHYRIALQWYDSRPEAERLELRQTAALLLRRTDERALTRDELARHILVNCGQWMRDAAIELVPQTKRPPQPMPRSSVVSPPRP